MMFYDLADYLKARNLSLDDIYIYFEFIPGIDPIVVEDFYLCVTRKIKFTVDFSKNGELYKDLDFIKTILDLYRQGKPTNFNIWVNYLDTSQKTGLHNYWSVSKRTMDTLHIRVCTRTTLII